jgi:hypothetical protein
MVGTTGFEPATSSVSRKRSNQLSYAPASRWLSSNRFQTKAESLFSLEPRANQIGFTLRKTSLLGSLTGLTHPAKAAASAGCHAVRSFLVKNAFFYRLPRVVLCFGIFLTDAVFRLRGSWMAANYMGPAANEVRTNVPCPIVRTHDSIRSTLLQTCSHLCASVWHPSWCQPFSRTVIG